MLRRKPTALTISPEDLVQFEDLQARKAAYKQYLKTGTDPNMFFTAREQNAHGATTTGEPRSSPGKVDPSDELKPLPGDKARIVRSREERIVGPGAGGR